MSKKKKGLTAQKLYKFLRGLKKDGIDLKKVSVNFREDYDSDVHTCWSVCEDLFDAETNNKLASIVIVERE